MQKARPRQLTIRSVPADIARRLEERARSSGKSINAVALEIFSDAFGVEPRLERLRRFMTWTPEELEEQEGYLREQRRVDDDLWT
jgi:hypothetical protein